MCTHKSLANQFPHLVAEWDQEKNGDRSPYELTSGSSLQVYWKCLIQEQHPSYPARISNRTKGSGCPYCSGKKVSIANCLETTHPELAKEWHPTLNKNLTSKDVTPGSNVNVYWKCPKNENHPAYFAKVANRTKNSSGCPYCFGRSVCEDNCLETTHPELTKEWHPTLNETITPKNVVAGSNMKFYWKCLKNEMHAPYSARVSSRTQKNPSGCPTCARTNKITIYDLNLC